MGESLHDLIVDERWLVGSSNSAWGHRMSLTPCQPGLSLRKIWKAP